jgi:hypothetical protein
MVYYMDPSVERDVYRNNAEGTHRLFMICVMYSLVSAELRAGDDRTNFAPRGASSIVPGFADPQHSFNRDWTWMSSPRAPGLRLPRRAGYSVCTYTRPTITVDIITIPSTGELCIEFYCYPITWQLHCAQK